MGKVRQLDEVHPHLREKPIPASTTFGAPLGQLDVGTVVRASQAVSGEIVLGKLIETLMRIAIEHAGAQRGLLDFFREGTNSGSRRKPPSAPTRSRSVFSEHP